MSRKWHKGPPPHVGWWNASMSDSSELWRWWDGHQWSVAVHYSETSKSAGTRATIPTATNGDLVRWTHYYPKNARVPRIDPRKVK